MYYDHGATLIPLYETIKWSVRIYKLIVIALLLVILREKTMLKLLLV